MGTAGRETFESAGDGGGVGAVVVNNNRDVCLQQRCRICACSVLDANDRIDIFAEDSRKKYLQTKIRKYLYILVSNEDKLSKMVCSTCVKRLEGVHRFATMAYRTQERLRLQFEDEKRPDEVDIVDGDTRDTGNDEKSQNSRLTNSENQRSVDHGLLHSILTKGGVEILTDKETTPITSVESDFGLSEIEASRDEMSQSSVSNMEEMEVKVDPMVFLECDLEGGSSDYSEESDDNNEGKCKDLSKNANEKQKSSIRDDERLTRDISGRESSGEGKGNEDESNDEMEKSASTTEHECTICARTFVTQMALQNHLWTHLPRERRYNEGKGILRSQHPSYSLNGLLHHSNSGSDNNSVNGNFVCPICGKRISTKGNLKVHLETHRPKGKYGCDICGRIFKTQSNLFRHKEYHGGVQFPCNVCGRVYPTNSTLRAHSITHSDLRPHACPLCDKTFKRNQDLKFHINQHTGARPYQCPYCPKAFASSGNCFSHRKRMHPREVHRDRQRAADLMR